MINIFTIDFACIKKNYDSYSLPFKEENYFRAALDTKFDNIEFLPKNPIYIKVNFEEIYPCQLLSNPFNWFLISDLMYKTLLSIEPI